MNVDINGNGARSLKEWGEKGDCDNNRGQGKTGKVILCVWLQPAPGGKANFLSKTEVRARAALTLLLK
jgi:hypothetical protein